MIWEKPSLEPLPARLADAAVKRFFQSPRATKPAVSSRVRNPLETRRFSPFFFLSRLRDIYRKGSLRPRSR